MSKVSDCLASTGFATIYLATTYLATYLAITYLAITYLAIHLATTFFKLFATPTKARLISANFCIGDRFQ